MEFPPPPPPAETELPIIRVEQGCCFKHGAIELCRSPLGVNSGQEYCAKCFQGEFGATFGKKALRITGETAGTVPLFLNVPMEAAFAIETQPPLPTQSPPCSSRGQ